MSIFKGSGVAIVTPMKENGEVNYDAYEALLEDQIANHTDAVITCGTSGEAPTLDDPEHLEVIKFTVDVVKGRIPVIAGTGSNNTAHAIMMSEEAEKLGADGLLLVTPYYNKATQNGLVEHYTAIASATKLPCILRSSLQPWWRSRRGMQMSRQSRKPAETSARLPNWPISQTAALISIPETTTRSYRS